MINRRVLGDADEWPQRLEDFTDPRFHRAIACASLNEMTTVVQFAALRAARGDTYTEDLIRRMRANGLQVYSSNLETRETLLRDGLAAALANSSNVHVFALEGQPVAEAWLDQEPGGLGTPVEAHTVALIRGGRNPEAARDFVDFLLSAEVQSLLARLYGETPVNPDAQHGWVRPLREIRRLEAPIDRLGELLDSTVHVLAAHGFRVARQRE
jgi:ABC-type Fe3+ transport system substrate-binding protein